MLLNRFLNILASANHARCGAAKLNEVLSYLGAVEHGVERGDFVDAGGGGTNDFCDLVHGCDRKPASMLTLGEIEEGDDSGLFVVGGVFGQNLRGFRNDESL